MFRGDLPGISGGTPAKVEAMKAIRALEMKLSLAGGSKRSAIQKRIDSLKKKLK